MADVEYPSGDNCPLKLIPIEMEVRLYEYLDGCALNELRKVDLRRRQIVDGNPREFEKKRLIPRVTVSCHRREMAAPSISFMDYCNRCLKRSYEVNLNFKSMSLESHSGRCRDCDRAFVRVRASQIIGLTLEECAKLVMRGAKIEKLTLEYSVSSLLLQHIRHLIDASFDIVLRQVLFESPQLFNDLVQEPRGLTMDCCDVRLNDEFFRSSGRGTLDLDELLESSVTDERLAILARRDDLKRINLNIIERGVTAEGVREVVQILLHSSTPKNIMFSIELAFSEFTNTLRLDAESSESKDVQGGFRKYSYTYGGGKVKVDADYCIGALTPYFSVRIVSLS